MKPVVDYQVAAAVDPTPLSLLTPGPDYSKYHDTWLEDKWFPFMGFVLGYGSLWYTHAMSRRPFHAGLPLKLGVGIASATAAYYFKQYRTAYLADKDAMYRQYIHMHPESFLSPERTKVGDLFKEWVPIFNGTTKLVPVKCRPQISNSKSSQMQVVRVHVPRGFPTGKTLKTEVTQIVDGFEEIKSI